MQVGNLGRCSTHGGVIQQRLWALETNQVNVVGMFASCQAPSSAKLGTQFEVKAQLFNRFDEMYDYVRSLKERGVAQMHVP